MKKILIPAFALLVLQGSYILKLRYDLDIRNKINEETILQAARIFDNVKYEQMPDDELPEPSHYTDSPNIIERINMLEMHLDYNPSKKWIKDVLNSAKIKLGA
jgi:hypothetical protein